MSRSGEGPDVTGGPASDLAVASAADVAVLAPRPVPDPLALAVVTAAADAVWPRPVVAPPPDAGANPWRFSGRWWRKPATMRRDRPWARP